MKDRLSQSALRPIRPRRSALAGPVAWGRVLTGITLTVGCVVWVDVIREFVLEASEGCDDSNTVDGDGCDAQCLLGHLRGGVQQS